jgi:hypothetical protein
MDMKDISFTNKTPGELQIESLVRTRHNLSQNFNQVAAAGIDVDQFTQSVANCLEIGLPSISLLPEGYKYHWSVPHSFFCSW